MRNWREHVLDVWRMRGYRDGRLMWQAVADRQGYKDDLRAAYDAGHDAAWSAFTDAIERIKRDSANEMFSTHPDLLELDHGGEGS